MENIKDEMDTFSIENMTLKAMNEYFVQALSQCHIIGDLNINKNGFLHLGERIHALRDTNSAVWRMTQFFECFAVFMVFCAVFDYDDNTYWMHVESYIGLVQVPERSKLFRIVESILKKYHFPEFKMEAATGYKYVTPIVCHAGIPVSDADTLFTAISNTIDDKFYDDFTLDDYLLYFNNRIGLCVSVKRFFQNVDRKYAAELIQELRMNLSEIHSEGSTTMLGVASRLKVRLNEWKKEPKNKNVLKAKRNVRLIAPQVQIEVGGVGVFVVLPSIEIKECIDDVVLWIIRYGEQEDIISCKLFSRKGIYHSMEKEVAIKKSNEIMVLLKIDDKLVSSWDFELLRRGYIAFSKNGLLIRREGLPADNIILLADENHVPNDLYDYDVIEMEPIPYWANIKVLSINLDGKQKIILGSKPIIVERNIKPKLYGGKRLFDRDDSDSYTQLPQILLPSLNLGKWEINILHKYEKDVIEELDFFLEENQSFFNLQNIIKEGNYGSYVITYRNQVVGKGKIVFEYVPNIEFGGFDDEWPEYIQGYKNDIFSITTDICAEILPYNIDVVSQTDSGEVREYKFRAEKHVETLQGDFRYVSNGREYTTSIRKKLRYITWGLNGINSDIISTQSFAATIYKSDIRKAENPFIYFNLNMPNYCKIRKMIISVISKKETVRKWDYAVEENNNIRIALDSLLLDINSENANDYLVVAELINSDDFSICKFIALKILEQIQINDWIMEKSDDNVFIRWNEYGTKTDRELVALNFTRPWLLGEHITLNDGECEVQVSKKGMSQGIYKFAVSKIEDDLFDEDENEFTKVYDFQRGILQVNNPIDETETENFLHRLLRATYLKKEKYIEEIEILKKELRQLNPTIPDDFDAIVMAYIVFSRYRNKKEQFIEAKGIIDAVFKKCSGYSAPAFGLTVRSNLSDKYKKEVFHKLYCDNLLNLKGINDLDRREVNKIDKDVAGLLYFIVDDDRGYSWAGITDKNVLSSSGEDIFSDEPSTYLTDKNLGNMDALQEFFLYYQKEISSSKGLRKELAQHIRDFEQCYEVNENKIFGKTRLALLIEWRQGHNRKEIINILSDIERYIIIVKNTDADVYKAISNRYENDREGYCIGIVSFVAALMRHNVIEREKYFDQILNRTIALMDKLYYRDAIIWELHLETKEESEWG